MLTNSISSIVYWMSNNLVVKIRVSCYRKKSYNEMEHFYKEFQSYNDNLHDYAISINLNYSYHLTLENTKGSTTDNTSIYIQLDYTGLYRMVELFETAVSWLRSEDIWILKNKRLALSEKGEKVRARHFIGLYRISIQPTLRNNNGIIEETITLTIHNQYNSELICSVLDIDKVYGNLEFFRRVDPVTLAQLLVNYMQIPKPGTNRVSMNPLQTQPNPILTDTKGSGIIGRKIGNKL